MSWQLMKNRMNVGDFCDNDAWVNMTDPRTYEWFSSRRFMSDRFTTSKTKGVYYDPDDVSEEAMDDYFKKADKFDGHNFGHHIVHIFKEY